MVIGSEGLIMIIHHTPNLKLVFESPWALLSRGTRSLIELHPPSPVLLTDGS